MRELGKGLLLMGVILAAIGAALMFLPRWRMPGDIVYRGKNVTVYFPIVTCIVISVVLTLVLWIVSAFRR